MMLMPGLKQFRHEGCLSYIVFDRAAKVAAVIDPRADRMDDYREYLAESGLRPILALDTHLHADHYSGTHLFGQAYGAEVAMSHHSDCARVTRKLRDGDRIAVGTLSFTALETPGHTPDSVCLHGGGMVFTGDTLLIGSTGRADFPGSDIEAQWSSLREKLLRLAGETIVLPGHDYRDLLFSTIDVEKRRNPHCAAPDLAAFRAVKEGEVPAHIGEEVRLRLDFNRSSEPPALASEGCGAAMACGAAGGASEPIATINVEKYFHKLRERAEGTCFVDVRETSEFQEGHMPGADNIPLSEVALHLRELLRARRVYFSCLSGRRSSLATRTLGYLGMPDAVNVSGGFQAWLSAGFPVQKPDAETKK